MTTLTTVGVAEAIVATFVGQGVTLADEAVAATEIAGHLTAWLGGEDAVSADLSLKLSTTIGSWNTNQLQFLDWSAGVVDGGPGSDGLYPLTNAAGVTRLFPCIAKIFAIVGTVDGDPAAVIAEVTALVAAAADSAGAAAVSVVAASDAASLYANSGIETGEDLVLGVISDPTGMIIDPVAATLDDEDNVAQALMRDGSSFVMKLLVATFIQMRQGGVDARHLLNYDWAVADDNDDVGAAIDALTKRFLAPFGVEIQDVYFTTTRAGYLLAAVRKSTNALLFGINTTGKLIADIDLDLGDAIDFTTAAVETGEYSYDWAVADEDGEVAIGVKDGVLFLPNYIQTANPYDVENLARSAAYKTRLITNLQRTTALYSTMVVYGQSLAAGQETYPALSRPARFGNLQLGGNVLPNTGDGASYSQIGSATLQPLSAQSINGTTLKSDADEAALSPGSADFGEPFNHGWVNYAKYLLNQHLLVENDATRLFVTINPSVSGKTIEQLSKVNTQDGTNRYLRYTGGLAKVETATGASSHVVAGIMWAQGEWDYSTANGSTKATKALYKAALNTLVTDMVADAKAATGQTLDPAFFVYQTGATYTADADMNGLPGLHVGMAQLEVAIERDKVFMVGPIYPVTDKGGHLDSNGSRWYGSQIGKVFHRVVTLGQDWSPLRPLRIRRVKLDVYIDFHVPEPPLAFDTPYVQSVAASYTDKGFKVTDTLGTIALSEVALAGQTIVRLKLAREPVGDAFVWYASKTTFNGNGMLRDSDPTVALDQYEYISGRGMYAAADIAALVNKPYPLHNWCVAFYLPITYSEI